MNREIKFRFWSRELKCFIDLFPHDLFQEVGFNGILASKDYITQQFTGLKDKNNKEIYEGDIIKCSSEFAKNTKREIGEVLYKESSFVIENNFLETEHKWQNDLSGYCGEFMNKMGYFCEIIGNIYENPDLLR